MISDIIFSVLGAIILVCIWVMLYDSHRFVIRNYTIRDSRIKKRTKAIVIADLHNKKYGKENEVLLNTIREQNPDCVLIAGDILTAVPGKTMEPAIAFLRELAKDFPIYYGNGNHEHRLKLYPEKYGTMAEEYERALKEIGIVPLVNSHVDLPELGLAVYGAEIDRKFYKRFQATYMEEAYLTQTLGEPNKDMYTILLAHNPDYFLQYVNWGADLTLSGHAHGGVARIPFWGKGVISPSLRLFPKYDGGIFLDNKATMILSRGLGAHTIPVRLFNPGEIWVVDFEPQE